METNLLELNNEINRAILDVNFTLFKDIVRKGGVLVSPVLGKKQSKDTEMQRCIDIVVTMDESGILRENTYLLLEKFTLSELEALISLQKSGVDITELVEIMQSHMPHCDMRKQRSI